MNRLQHLFEATGAFGAALMVIYPVFGVMLIAIVSFRVSAGA